MQDSDVLATVETPLLKVAAQMVPADVVGTSFEQRHAQVDTQGRAYPGKIPMKELVLEISRSGADDDRPSRQQRRHQVCEGLACSGTRLCNKRLARGYRLTDSMRQCPLPIPHRKARDLTRELTISLEGPRQALEVAS